MEFIFPIAMGFSILLVLGLGIMIKYYKAYWLISGYNMMNKEQKEKVDIEGLARFTGNMCIVMATILFLATVFIIINQELLSLIMFAAIFLQSINLIIKAPKFDGNNKKPDGTMNKKSKIIVGGIVALLILTFSGVGILLYFSNQPPDFIIEDEYFQIKSLYGETIPIREIDDISLQKHLPKITFKNNGSSIGDKKKGNFKLEDIGDAKLFVNTSHTPFIYIVRKEKLIILNYEQSERTEKLYKELFTAWEKLKE